MTKLIWLVLASAFWVGISFAASVYFLHEGANEVTAYQNTCLGMFVVTTIMGRCRVSEMFLCGAAFATAVSTGCWATYHYTGDSWWVMYAPFGFFFVALMALSVATDYTLQVTRP